MVSFENRIHTPQDVLQEQRIRSRWKSSPGFFFAVVFLTTDTLCQKSYMYLNSKVNRMDEYKIPDHRPPMDWKPLLKTTRDIKIALLLRHIFTVRFSCSTPYFNSIMRPPHYQGYFVNPTGGVSRFYCIPKILTSTINNKFDQMELDCRILNHQKTPRSVWDLNSWKLWNNIKNLTRTTRWIQINGVRATKF